MASNGDWGVLVEHDPDMADAWDHLDPLPEAGINPTLDAFVARKNISLNALVRIGARLFSDSVLAFAYPGGVKYRDMDTGIRWNYIGSDFTAMKIVPHGLEPSDTVIVAEGETDGAWLTENYPVDIALLPVGAKGIKPEYLKQLLLWDRVLVGLDRDAAGEAGWQKIKAGVPHAQRFFPVGNDWCEHGPDSAGPIPEPEIVWSERAGTIIFQDLTAAWNLELPAPKILADDLIYDQGVHWLSAHPDSGKSIVAMHISWLVMDHENGAGRHVVWLDYEQGKRMTGQRLREMGVPLPLIQEQFHWAWYPMDAVDSLLIVAEKYPGALVVVDSISKALAQAGIGENENAEVLQYTIKLIQVSKQLDLPVLVIDHVTKGDKNSDYARGAGTKQADTDVHWKVNKLEPFNRTQKGLIELTLHKDREGRLPPQQFFSVGDGGGGLGLMPVEGPEPDDPLVDELPPV